MRVSTGISCLANKMRLLDAETAFEHVFELRVIESYDAVELEIAGLVILHLTVEAVQYKACPVEGQVGQVRAILHRRDIGLQERIGRSVGRLYRTRVLEHRLSHTNQKLDHVVGGIVGAAAVQIGRGAWRERG